VEPATTLSTDGPDAVDPAGTTALPPPPLVAPPAAGALPAVDNAFEGLRHGNLAVSITVLRDGAPIYRRAGGTTLGGEQVTTATPMVLASVSKLITSLTIARLVEQRLIDLDAPVPWTAMGIAHDPAWDSVTPRELLGHTSGMPIARDSWLNDPGSCAVPLQEAMAAPPRAARGTWVYSNGNYCALGLLAEHAGGLPREVLARQLALDALTTHGAHLTTDAPAPADGPYAKGVARLERLGGAGTWMASTDTIAEMLAAVTAGDQLTMAYPAVMVDQYGWGHTGTVDGAKACAWRLDGGRTEIVAVVAGNRPGSGGGLCDLLLPALHADLGLADLGKPHRLPD
jgi:CubicO group peptidase (beta-lactamase class C family)